MVEIAIARADRLDPETYTRLRAGLPAHRQRRCDEYWLDRDRYASAAVFALLQQQWLLLRGHKPMPEVFRAAHGKPYFARAAGLEFGLTHDGWLAACAVASEPIGFDAQSQVSFGNALFERMSADSELGLRGPLKQLDDLSWLWSRKEAVIKRTGIGMSADLRSVDTLVESGLASFTVAGLDTTFAISVGHGSADELLQRCRVRILEPECDASAARGVRWHEQWAELVPLDIPTYETEGWSCTKSWRSSIRARFATA